MSSPLEWTEADLLQLCAAATPEDVGLEFKASPSLNNLDVKKNEIVKDVSAMANSAGGVIVYGISEAAGRAYQLDGGVDDAERKAEWLEKVINSIQPRVDGVRVRPVPLPNCGADRQAILVLIPQSIRAPHQARDKKYYKRHGTEALPMEDYEVRDTARRALAPDLRVVVSVIPGEMAGFGEKVLLAASLENEADVPAEYALIELWIDARLDPSRTGFEKMIVNVGNRRRGLPARHLVVPWSGRTTMPVFRGVTVPIIPRVACTVPVDGAYLVRWRAATSLMTTRAGNVIFDRLGGSMTLTCLDVTDDVLVQRPELPWRDEPSAGSLDSTIFPGW